MKRLYILALALTAILGQSNAADAQCQDKSNTVLESLKTRRAIRSYSPEMPSDELLAKVTEAGTFAPTGMGMQSPLIVVVKDKETRDEIARLNASVMGRDTDPFYGAPVVIVVLADRKMPTYINDGSLVMGNLLNAAHAVGLGSCWVHRAKEVFDMPEGKALLKKWGIEGDYEGIGNCIIGIPDPTAPAPVAKPRKDGYVIVVD